VQTKFDFDLLMTLTKPQLLNLETIELRLVKVGFAWIESPL